MAAPKVPEALKADLPHNRWGKILGATPVIMTVIATLLAGLSNSEMTKAQYARSLAAQQQSKAADQWGFFQAKRLRGAIQSGTLDVARLAPRAQAFSADGLRAFAATLPDPEPVKAALDFLLSGKLPDEGKPAAVDPAIKAILDGIEDGVPDDEMVTRLHAVPSPKVTEAVHAALARSRDFDDKLGVVVGPGDRLGDAIETANRPELVRDFTELRLRYSSTRYDAEAALNRAVGSLIEVQVRQSNLSAERHHRRSQRFFYGMLGAQAAVIIATFAMAARQRNLLWSLAAAAGLCAILFATYVFLYL